MVDHTGVSAITEFPIPVKYKIVELTIGHYISRKIGTVTCSLNTSVDYCPGLGQRVAIVITPAIKGFTIKKQFPTIGDFGL